MFINGRFLICIMGLVQYLRNAWKKPDMKLVREKMIGWRKEPVVLKISRPTRLDRARALGYKAKKGIIVVRVRVLRGGRKRELFKSGRRSRARRRKKIVGKSYQWISEERANKKFKNLAVLNSYWLAKDGRYIWHEVILVDPCAPEIKSDKNLNWVCTEKQRTRVYRGRTSAGRRSRGLSKKGKGAEKIRPSLSSNKRRAK